MCLLKKEKWLCHFFWSLTQTIRTFAPIKFFRHLVSAAMSIFLSACFLHFGFLFRQSTYGLAALWSDASLEAGPLSALTKPQIVFYKVLKHGISPSFAYNSKLISGFTSVIVSRVVFYDWQNIELLVKNYLQRFILRWNETRQWIFSAYPCSCFTVRWACRTAVFQFLHCHPSSEYWSCRIF